MFTAVYLFHCGSWKNCWYAWPARHILFGVCILFCFALPPRFCSFCQLWTLRQWACIICFVLTTCSHSCPFSSTYVHRKPSWYTGISLHGGSSGCGNCTPEMPRATSSSLSTYLWACCCSPFSTPAWFLCRWAAIWLGTTAVRQSIHTTIQYCGKCRNHLANTVSACWVIGSAIFSLAIPLLRPFLASP